MADLPPPNYFPFVPRMNDSLNEWKSEPGFEYDLNDGYNTAALDILDWIFPAAANFSGFKLNPADLTDFNGLGDTDYVWDNNGPVGFLSVGLLMTIIMILAGIIWCTVKFCCCCLRRRKDEDQDMLVEDSREKFARIGCTVGLAIWIAFFAAALSGCFIANEQMRKAIRGIPEDLNNGLNDTQLYLDVTIKQIDAIFIDCYDVFQRALRNSLPPFIATETNSLLWKAVENTNSLSLHLELAENSISESKNNIAKLIKDCKSEICQEFEIGVLDQLHLAPIYKSLVTFVTINIPNAVQNLSNQAKVPPEWELAISRAGQELRGNATSMTNALKDVPIQSIKDEVNKIENAMNIGADYAYVALLLICLVMLLVPIVFIIGAAFGCVGNPRARCCTRRSGGSFMNCGIFTIFFVGWFLWILALGGFVFSGVLTQVVCESIRDFEKNDSLVDKPAPPTNGDSYVLPIYPEIIQSCKRQSGAFQAFRLEQVFNVNEVLNLRDRFPQTIPNSWHTVETAESVQRLKGIESQLREFSEQLKTADLVDTTLLEKLGKVGGNIATELSKLQDMQRTHGDLIKNDVTKLIEVLKGILNTVEGFLNGARITAGPHEIIDGYGYFVHNATLSILGECEPLWNAVDATIHLFCYKVAAPISAYWLSLTLILLIFIPMLITAMLLEKLYRSSGGSGYTV